MTYQHGNGADVLDGLPPDLVRVLRDPSIIVPQDQAVFELIASWMNAPCDTASALTADLRSHEPPRNSDPEPNDRQDASRAERPAARRDEPLMG